MSTIACNLDRDILAASIPLFEEARIDALEWSFDALYQYDEIPNWFTELLQFYSDQHRLIGHGVYFSIFSGRWSSSHSEWLKHLERMATQFPFDHITEHFGFMTGKDFHQGAPLNVPITTNILRIGRDRLMRIHEACKCPVGLENLAFSYSLDETRRHGDFLEKLVEEVNGFIILDLHNLYCQLHNFSLDAEGLLASYPLHRVREIHISGGSWEKSQVDSSRLVRRDTHDDSVPPEVFELLKIACDRCPNLKYIVLEQLGSALSSEQQRRSFYADFIRMKEIVDGFNRQTSSEIQNSFMPAPLPILHPEPIEDIELYNQQRQLSTILENAGSVEEAVDLLAKSSLAGSSWNIEGWAPYMLETAMQIAQKWK